MKAIVKAAFVMEGFSSILRGGRSWPAREAVTVEVVSGDDPTVEVDAPVDGRPSKRLVPDPTRIGSGVLEALKADRRFEVVVEQ